jgi:hypothetical protein
MRGLRTFFIAIGITFSFAVFASDGSALTAAQLEAVAETPVQGIAKIDPPLELYHWLSARSLEKQATEYATLGFFPLKALNESFFGARFSEFSASPGLFAWSNPVLGMAHDKSEIYGNAERVLRFEIRPEAKTALMVSSYEGAPVRLPVNPKEYDLILHVVKFRFANGTLGVAFKEWIILNPDIIRSVTADPEVLRPLISPWIAQAKNSGVKFREADMHVSSFYYEPRIREKRMVKSLEKWDALSSEEIPTKFRGKLVLNPNPSAVEEYRCRILLLPPEAA